MTSLRSTNRHISGRHAQRESSRKSTLDKFNRPDRSSHHCAALCHQPSRVPGGDGGDLA
jgi:hypothetical protein